MPCMQAAMHIQAAYRGYVVRMALAARWAAAQRLQAAARGFLVRRQLRAQVQIRPRTGPLAARRSTLVQNDPNTGCLSIPVLHCTHTGDSPADAGILVRQDEGAHEVRLYGASGVKAARKCWLCRIGSSGPVYKVNDLIVVDNEASLPCYLAGRSCCCHPVGFPWRPGSRRLLSQDRGRDPHPGSMARSLSAPGIETDPSSYQNSGSCPRFDRPSAPQCARSCCPYHPGMVARSR